MKFNLNMLLILVVSASVAMAATVCPSTTLANGTPPPAYENPNGSANGFVCDFGGLEFSDFHSAVPGIVVPAAMGISPRFQQDTPPANTNPGFFFTGPFAVGAGGLQDVYVAFTVTALTGMLTDVHIQLDNSFVTGTGQVSYTEQVCYGPQDNCALFVDNPTGSLTADLVLATPQKSILISKDLVLSGGSNGTATMSVFSNYYSHSEVPEPRAISAFLGLGFIGVMVFMKFRQSHSKTAA